MAVWHYSRYKEILIQYLTIKYMYLTFILSSSVPTGVVGTNYVTGIKFRPGWGEQNLSFYKIPAHIFKFLPWVITQMHFAPFGCIHLCKAIFKQIYRLCAVREAWDAGGEGVGGWMAPPDDTSYYWPRHAGLVFSPSCSLTSCTGRLCQTGIRGSASLLCVHMMPHTSNTWPPALQCHKSSSALSSEQQS